MAITEQTGLNMNIDGILGLGANKMQGPSYVWALKNNGIIDKAILSFSLGYNSSGGFGTEQSYMIFGGVNET